MIGPTSKRGTPARPSIPRAPVRFCASETMDRTMFQWRSTWAPAANRRRWRRLRLIRYAPDGDVREVHHGLIVVRRVRYQLVARLADRLDRGGDKRGLGGAEGVAPVEHELVVGRAAAATTMILEGSTNVRFKGEVGLGEVVRDSTVVGKSVPRGGESTISLCAGTMRAFVGAFELFAPAEALVAVRSAEPSRT